MTTARYQNGCISRSVNGSGTPIWIFRWYETQVDGRRIRKKKQIGTLDQFRTEAAAEKAAMGLRLAINSEKKSELNTITMEQLAQHFRDKELVDYGEEGRAWSTRDRYESCLNHWIGPRCGSVKLSAIKAPMVEEWLRKLKRQPRSGRRNSLPWKKSTCNLLLRRPRPRFVI